MAMPIERDEMVAIFEYKRFGQTREHALKVIYVSHARPIVPTRMHDERWLTYVRDLTPNPSHQPTQLEHQIAG